jgi:hypothetical protein
VTEIRREQRHLRSRLAGASVNFVHFLKARIRQKDRFAIGERPQGNTGPKKQIGAIFGSFSLSSVNRYGDARWGKKATLERKVRLYFLGTDGGTC